MFNQHPKSQKEVSRLKTKLTVEDDSLPNEHLPLEVFALLRVDRLTRPAAEVDWLRVDRMMRLLAEVDSLRVDWLLGVGVCGRPSCFTRFPASFPS